jgi:glycosyltransferase involved in cell wall biosynthesis
MAAAKPVLLAMRGDAADIIRTSEVGIVVEPENPEALATGIVEIYSRSETALKQMGASGALYYRKNMSMAIGVNKFDKLFRSLCCH